MHRLFDECSLAGADTQSRLDQAHRAIGVDWTNVPAWASMQMRYLVHCPRFLFFAFQMTFAVITPALIVGAYVERINFSFVLIFSGLWMLLCYAPVVHWIWGGGMMADGGIFGEVGTKDFAGGIVVHETAGLAALYWR